MKCAIGKPLWMGCLLCLAIIVGGWVVAAVDPQCRCAKPAESEIYAQLSWAPLPAAPAAAAAQPGGVVAPAAVAQPTPIGVVRLLYGGTPRYVALPVGQYTLDFGAISDVVRCGTCPLESPTQCTPTTMRYSIVKIDGENVPVQNDKVTFTLAAGDTKSHKVELTVNYLCEAKECYAGQCTGTYQFGFKRAGETCQCGTYGFTVTIKNKASGATASVARPAVLTSLDRAADTTILIGSGLSLARDTEVEIQICAVTGSCYCRDGLCPMRFPGDARAVAAAPRGDLRVQFVDGAFGCSVPRDGRWNSNASCYSGTTTLTSTPGGSTSVYVLFEIAYKCEQSATCKAMPGYCKQMFKIQFVL